MLRGPGCGGLEGVPIWGEGVLLVGTDHPLGKDGTWLVKVCIWGEGVLLVLRYWVNGGICF